MLTSLPHAEPSGPVVLPISKINISGPPSQRTSPFKPQLGCTSPSLLTDVQDIPNDFPSPVSRSPRAGSPELRLDLDRLHAHSLGAELHTHREVLEVHGSQLIPEASADAIIRDNAAVFLAASEYVSESGRQADAHRTEQARLLSSERTALAFTQNRIPATRSTVEYAQRRSTDPCWVKTTQTDPVTILTGWGRIDVLAASHTPPPDQATATALDTAQAY